MPEHNVERERRREKKKVCFAFVFSWSKTNGWHSGLCHSHLPDLLHPRRRAFSGIQPVLQHMQGFQHQCHFHPHARSLWIGMEQAGHWLQEIVQGDPQTVRYRQMAPGGWSTGQAAVEEFLEQTSKFTPQATRCGWTKWGQCLASTSWREQHFQLWKCWSKSSLMTVWQTLIVNTFVTTTV